MQMIEDHPFRFQVMITFLIEMLELPNFDHMTTSRKYFESDDKIWLVMP